MATLATINIKATFDGMGITKGTQKAQRDLQSFGSAGSKTFGVMATKVAGFVAAVATIRMAISIFNRTRNAIDEMAKSADRLGISVQTMQALSLAGNLAGNNMQDLSTAMARMSSVLDDAIMKGGESAEAFKRLGLNLSELANMSPDQQFFKVGAALNEVSNASERNALAMDIFGRSGSKFLSFFKNAEGSVEEARKKLESWGVLLDAGDTANIERMNDAWTTMTTLIQGIADKFVATIAPTVAALLEYTTDLLMPTEGVESVWESIGMWIEVAGAFAANFISVMVGGFRVLSAASNVFFTMTQLGIAGLQKMWIGFFGEATDDIDREIERLINLVGYYVDVGSRGIDDIRRGFTGEAGDDFVRRLDEIKAAAEKAKTPLDEGSRNLVQAATTAAETIKVAFKDISPAALEAGSTSAASAIAKAQRDADGNKTEKAMLKQLTEIAKNTKGPGLLPANI